MSRYYPRMDWHISTPSHAKIAVTEHLISDAPAGLDGLKVLFASDFHMRKGMDPNQIVSLMNSCRADLILLGGDFSDTRDGALRLFRAFRSLRSPLGICSARGNNDTEAFPCEEDLHRALNAFGCVLLVNNCHLLTYNGVRLLIGGIDEYWHGHPEYGRVFPAEVQADYRILLSHYPVFPENAAPPDLMLSGHTHGGQFNALGLNPYSIGFERMGKKNFPPVLISGTTKIGTTMMIVSKGIGVSRIPLRIGVRPEIHLLKFQKTTGI